MNGESRLLVTDELCEFGKLVEVQDIRTIADHFRINKETWNITTCNGLDLEALGLCARISLDTAPTFTPKEPESIASETGSVAPSMSLVVAFLLTDP